jgi:hypothetical protein
MSVTPPVTNWNPDAAGTSRREKPGRRTDRQPSQFPVSSVGGPLLAGPPAARVARIARSRPGRAGRASAIPPVGSSRGHPVRCRSIRSARTGGLIPSAEESPPGPDRCHHGQAGAGQGRTVNARGPPVGRAEDDPDGRTDRLINHERHEKNRRRRPELISPAYQYRDNLFKFNILRPTHKPITESLRTCVKSGRCWIEAVPIIISRTQTRIERRGFSGAPGELHAGIYVARTPRIPGGRAVGNVKAFVPSFSPLCGR